MSVSKDTKATPPLNVLRSKPVLQAVDSSWMRMRNVYVRQDMPLMRRVIVCPVQATLGSLSTPKADACAIARADSSLISYLEDVFAQTDTDSTSREFAKKVSHKNCILL